MKKHSSDFKLPAIGSGDWHFRHSESLSFPVALGSKSSDIWPAVVPELPKNLYKQEERIQECAILRFRSANTWSTLILQLMNLPLNILWQSLLIMIICINYLFTTYVYTFENRNTGNVILQLCVLDIIYLTDFVVCLLQRHLRNLAIYMNINLRSICLLCLSAVTLVPVVPVYILILGEASDPHIVFWLRSITFLRFCNIYIYLKNWKSAAGRHRYLCFLVEFTIIFSHLLHTFSCIWYCTKCVGKGCALNWYSPFEKQVRCFRGYCEMTWKAKIPEEKDSGRVWYLVCLYFWIGIMTGSANGDILPLNMSETIFCIFGMFISLGLVSGIYQGRLINFYVDSKKRKTLFRNQLTEIKKYLRNVGVSKDIEDETMKYYNILWKKKKGVVETNTFYSLPLSFQREVCYDIYINVFHQSIILRNLDEAFLREISLRMKCTFHLPGEVIYHKNLVKQMMIYVNCGTLEILSDEDDESPLISFTKGTFLGEIALAITVPAKATVRAATYVELQILHKVDFLRVIKDFPEAFKVIEEELFRRTVGAVNMQNDELNDCVILNNVVSQTEKRSSIRQLKKVLRFQQGIQMADGSFGGADCITKDNLNETFVSLYTLTDNISKSSEPIICLSASFPWILLPDSSLKKAWHACVIASVFFIATIYPYHSIFNKVFPSWLIFFGHIIDIFFAMDCFVQCITVAEKGNIKIVKVKDIINYRLDHLTFYLDVFSVIPFEYGAGFVEDPFEAERIACLLRLNRLLRCYKIVTLFSEVEGSLTVNITCMTVLKCQVYTLILCLWLGSILYLMTCFTSDCNEHGWFHHKTQFELERKDISPCYETPFLFSIYYGLSILLCIGFGDILPASKLEVVCVILFIVFGFLFSGFVTSTLSGSLTLSRRSFSSYREMVQAIKKYMKDNMMSKHIQQRVCDYFYLQWKYNSGILITDGNNFTVGSTAINQKIVTKERMDSILCVPVFQDLDSDFLQIIAAGSRVLTLPPNEYVTYIGELSREMYVITQGYCEIAGLSNKMLGPSDYFGDLEMLFGIPSKQNVLTVTHCQLLNINYTVFSQAISLFPEIMDDLTNVINDYDIINQLDLTEKIRQTRYTTRGDKLTTESNKMLQVLSKIKGSFVNVWKECRKTGEDYSRPFRYRQGLKVFKFLLLPITILPDGCCFRVWCTLRLISACFVGVFDPFFQSTGHYSSWVPKIVNALTVFAYVDLYVMMLICYHNDMGILVKHPLYTAYNYIKHNFIVDLLACFPVNFLLEEIGYKDYEHSGKLKLFLSFIKLNKILQIYRIPAHIQYFQYDSVMVHHLLQLLKIVLITAITLNVMTSFLVSATCSYIAGGHQTTRIGFTDEHHSSQSHTFMKCHNGSWFSMSAFKDIEDPVLVYFAAYFWVLSSASALGMDDITAENGVELFICICFVVIGSSLFGYIIANIVSSNISIHNNIVYYREMMNELTSYMRAENVNKDLQKSLINHFEYEWKRSAGYHPQKVFEKLNSALMEDSVWYLYRQTFRAVPLFAHVEERFLRVMGKHMEEVYFLRGSTIVRSGDIQSYIYIIYRGKVNVTTRNNIAINMDVGGIFGNIKSINASQSFVTIKALRNVDTLMIRSETFYNILKSYPHIESRLNSALANVDDFLVPSKLNEVQSEEFLADLIPTPKRESQFSEGEIDLNKSEDSSVSSSTIEEEDSQTGRSFSLKNPVTWNNFAILPESMIFSVMGYTILIVSYINIIMVSYQITFQECSTWFIAISSLAEFIFYFNIVLELHQAYVGKYGETVTDPTKMRKRYFKNRTKVLINVFCDSPIELISYIFDYSSGCSIFRIVRLLHLGRVYYIFHFFKARENLLSSNRSLLKLSRMLITFTLITHFLSCFLFLIKNTIKNTPFETYIDCFHHVTIIASSVGYGTVGKSMAVVIYSIVLMFINIIVLAYFIADLTTILNNSSSSLVNYEYSISILKDVLLNNHLSSHQMKKVWQYVTKLWDKSRGNQMPRFVKKAPLVLHCDLMNDIYGEHIRKSYIFAELDDNFLRQVTARLQHNVHFEDNYIVQHGDTDQNMYFIHRGQVNVLTVHPNLTETIHDILVPFDVFGIAQGLYHGLPHHFSFRAKTVVDILVLNLNDWYFMLKYFPDVQKILYNRANNIYIGPYN